MKTKFKDKNLAYAITFITTSFIIFLIGILTSYPENIFYFSAGIILFLIGDFFITKTIFNKKI